MPTETEMKVMRVQTQIESINQKMRQRHTGKERETATYANTKTTKTTAETTVGDSRKTDLTYVQGEALEATGRCSRRVSVALAAAALQLAVEVLGMTLHVTNVFDDATDVLRFVGLCLVLGWCVPIMGGRPLCHVRAGEADGPV